MASRRQLVNQWVIHTGPRIRLSIDAVYYRSGAYMYYYFDATIHGLDYRQSWYGWYLDMAVYLDGTYMGTTRLKQNQPKRWSSITRSTSWYSVKNVSGTPSVKIVITSNKPRYGQVTWSSGSALPVEILSTSGNLEITDINEAGAMIKVSSLPTGYDKELRIWKRKAGDSWGNYESNIVPNGGTSTSKALNNLLSNTPYEIWIDEYVGGTKVTTFKKNFETHKATGGLRLETTESELTIIQELNPNIGYERSIEWHIRPAGGSIYTLIGTNAIKAGTSSLSKTIDKLTSGYRYEIKTVLKVGENILNEYLGAGSILPSSAKISARSETFNIITINISHLVKTGWKRQIKVKYKARSESIFRELNLESENEQEEIILRNLKAYTEYDIRLTINRDEFAIKSWANIVKTKEMGFVAVPVIRSIDSIIMTKDVVISWSSNEDRPEMSYDIEWSADGRLWNKLITTNYRNNLKVSLPNGNIDCFIRIKGYATDSTKVSYSEEYPVYIFFKFDYDTEVSENREIKLTSKEINRLISFINKKAGSTIEQVKSGERITLAKYNQFREKLKLTTKAQGDIKAFDWLELKNKVNEE